ncbi:TPA: hypothetical protein N0F65_011742 [Lagenidium giganteum]|uniref:Integrase catalytic domain-containing protein n=1 Tax=Lagenidium giganteum TaxID=4803 RepID=A0AAV2YI07_9STRA|nr:TPA: hypothetical protein N0F65_011742 [Lagenidium giganteum]
MSTAAHPQTDGQTERVNRVIEDILRSFATSFDDWSDILPVAEFAINNAGHASTGASPFFANYARHPRMPIPLIGRSARLNASSFPQSATAVTQDETGAPVGASSGFDATTPLDNGLPQEKAAVQEFVDRRHGILRYVRDCVAEAVDTQKQHADAHENGNHQEFNVGDLVLLSTRRRLKL